MHTESSRMMSSLGDRALMALALAGAFLALLQIWGERHARLGAGEIRVGALRVEGRVRLRHARSLHWDEVRGEEAVYVRDVIYVPQGSRAWIMVGSRRQVELDPGSMV